MLAPCNKLHRVLPAGMILLEVSVVVFLLQGYVTTGREVRSAAAAQQPVNGNISAINLFQWCWIAGCADGA